MRIIFACFFNSLGLGFSLKVSKTLGFEGFHFIKVAFGSMARFPRKALTPVAGGLGMAKPSAQQAAG